MEDEAVVRLAATRADYDACVDLQRKVWGLQDVEVVSAIQMIATTHAGGFVLLAEAAGGAIVGFSYAFPAVRGTPHLHSDMTGVLPAHQKHGLGPRLKWAQRDEALRRGIALVTWTFDPMQARNAHLNLRRLGAESHEFLPNFYGVTTSALHHGMPTDRLLVSWELRSPRVIEQAAGREPPRGSTPPPYPRINEGGWRAGWPVSSEPRLDLEDPELLLEIPPDWNVLCQSAPHVAEDWHGKVHRALERYMGAGYVAADFVPAEDEGGRRRPVYVLRKR
jgi:predicted GNAT superfamily acetyltransferase